MLTHTVQVELGARALLFNVTTLVAVMQSPWMLTETRAAADRLSRRARIVEIPYFASASARAHDAFFWQPRLERLPGGCGRMHHKLITHMHAR